MRTCILLLTLMLSGAALAADRPATRRQKVERLQLDNGLTVLLRPVRGAKEVALVVLYSIGGDHDPRGQSGLAHLIEHVYVTAAAGTEKARTINEYMKRYPSGWNAQTGDRHTVIAAVFPLKELDRELKDAAARMSELRVTAADLKREKPRVDDELANMFGGLPIFAAWNYARELAWPTPQGGRKGGLPGEVKVIKLAAIQKRLKDYYKPTNAILVLAGAVDVAAARKKIETHFGKLPTGKKPPTAQPHGKAGSGKVREVAVKPLDPKAGPEVCLAYVAPAPGSDLYAPFLMLLARMQLQSPRLKAGRDRYPVQYPVLDDPAVVLLNVPARPKETAGQAINRLKAFVAGAVRPTLRTADVTLTRNLYGFLLGISNTPDAQLAENLYGLAFSLARREQLGIDPGKLNKALEKVTREALSRAAKEVFGPDRPAAAFISIKR